MDSVWTESSFSPGGRGLTVFGWRVNARTRSHVLPRGFIERGEVATSSGMGRNTILLLHRPTENPVNPAMAPWTAFWASCMQSSKHQGGKRDYRETIVGREHCDRDVAIWWRRLWCLHRLSAALAGTDRIVYEGSMYLTVATSPCLIK